MWDTWIITKIQDKTTDFAEETIKKTRKKRYINKSTIDILWYPLNSQELLNIN